MRLATRHMLAAAACACVLSCSTRQRTQARTIGFKGGVRTSFWASTCAHMADEPHCCAAMREP